MHYGYSFKKPILASVRPLGPCHMQKNLSLCCQTARTITHWPVFMTLVQINPGSDHERLEAVLSLWSAGGHLQWNSWFWALVSAGKLIWTHHPSVPVWGTFFLAWFNETFSFVFWRHFRSLMSKYRHPILKMFVQWFRVLGTGGFFYEIEMQNMKPSYLHYYYSVYTVWTVEELVQLNNLSSLGDILVWQWEKAELLSWSGNCV